MPACSRKKCTDQRMPGSIFCRADRNAALARITPKTVSTKQQIVRELRWRSGSGSGVTV